MDKDHVQVMIHMVHSKGFQQTLPEIGRNRIADLELYKIADDELGGGNIDGAPVPDDVCGG